MKPLDHDGICIEIPGEPQRDAGGARQGRRGGGVRVRDEFAKAFEAHRNRPWWRRALRWLNFRARARSKRRAEYIADRIYGRAPSIMIWKSKEDQ